MTTPLCINISCPTTLMLFRLSFVVFLFRRNKKFMLAFEYRSILDVQFKGSCSFYLVSDFVLNYPLVQWGSWKNSLNWRKVFKCLNFIWQTWYLKYKLFNWCLCPWVFRLPWKPKLFFWTVITAKISIFLVADTWLYTLPCRSVGPSVRPKYF